MVGHLSDGGDLCAICQQEGNEGESWTFLTCAHKFHTYCIDESAKHCKERDVPVTCPTCKSGALPNDTDEERVMDLTAPCTLVDGDSSGSAAPDASQEDPEEGKGKDTGKGKGKGEDREGQG